MVNTTRRIVDFWNVIELVGKNAEKWEAGSVVKISSNCVWNFLTLWPHLFATDKNLNTLGSICAIFHRSISTIIVMNGLRGWHDTRVGFVKWNKLIITLFHVCNTFHTLLEERSSLRRIRRTIRSPRPALNVFICLTAFPLHFLCRSHHLCNTPSLPNTALLLFHSSFDISFNNTSGTYNAFIEKTGLKVTLTVKEVTYLANTILSTSFFTGPWLLHNPSNTLVKDRT